MTARHWLQGIGIVLMAEATFGRFGRWFGHYDVHYRFHPIVFLVGAVIFCLAFVTEKGSGNGGSGTGSSA
jgi:hypothetical protein